MEYSSIYAGTIDALAFAAGAALCTMMAILQWRSPQVTGGSRDLILLWLCGALWTACSFVVVMLLMAGAPETGLPVQWMMTLAWTSTCIGPVVALRGLDHGLQGRLPARRALLTIGTLAGLGVLGCFLYAASNQHDGYRLIDAGVVSFFVSLAFALASGVAYLILKAPRKTDPARYRSPLGSLVLAFWGVWIALTLFNILTPHGESRLDYLAARISQHWAIPISILVAVSMARTHYADVVLKRSLVLLLSIFGSAAIAWQIPGIPPGVPLVAASLTAAALMLSAPSLYRLFSTTLDRHLLKRPDYRALSTAFAENARRATEPETLAVLTEAAIGQALGLQARIGAREDDDEELVPLSGGTSVALSPGFKARALMQAEHSFLETIGAEFGHRRAALAFEAERRERETREARLQHAVTEARLEALRAQVDPHFLFNTLNAITDLIATDPEKAEVMTERLAAFFRYTLNRQEQALASLDEELDFVRQYLDIEKVRFGDRLEVEIRKDGTLGEENVPSLILQPLVENALRHGLSSRREGGRISITAGRDGAVLRLEVADDGVGFTEKSKDRVGLKNVRERLKALHGEAASMTIGKGPGGRGASVVLCLPA